jgi:glutamine amidotransferase
MTPITINLVDAGVGNLRSVQKALEALGARVNRASSPAGLLPATPTVLPGVGAFGDFMSGLRRERLDEAVLGYAQSAIPLLGICVGMQALFDVGLEMGEHRGLGLLPGVVVRFPPSPVLKVPHTGWNQLHLVRPSPLTVGLTGGEYAYFNHSYYCLPTETSDVILETEYLLPFASAVQRHTLFGVQFHPEKSQTVGLKLLANFLQSCRREISQEDHP